MLKQQSVWSLEALLVPFAIVVSICIEVWDHFTEPVDIESHHDGQYVTTSRSEIIRDTQRTLEELS